MKNKKTFIIGIIVIIIFCIGYYYIKNNQVTISLVGNDLIVVEYGKAYKDDGYKAYNGLGVDLSKYVTVTNNVDTLKPGTYNIIYHLAYNNVIKDISRTVIVKNITINDLELKLNGDDHIYLLKGNNYIEEGATIYNKIDNKVFNGNISITNNIKDQVGDYEVNYIFNYRGESITVNRMVTVFDIVYDVSPKELTYNNVKVNLDLSSVPNYTYTKLPDGYTVLKKNIDYTITKNGDYTFTIVLSDKKEYQKIVTVDNIISNYTCSGDITSLGSRLTISPVDSSIKGYQWNIDNEIINGGSLYTKQKSINKASVKLSLSNNKEYTVNCSITDKLVYHFKYDENNTKPYMSCNTYTNADKVRLDAQLKQVVQEAGYGTRAGAVAAARFLVGGLDYKVQYMGPNKGTYEIGRYPYEGLNIGKSGAWGCRVSGYIQGMDCTNFVSWVWTQNGIKDNPYKDKSQQINVRNNINKLKPGDLLYSPCSGECKNDMGLAHVGIIIGIDDRYIYVAESTTGTIDAIVVTKWEKYNMPTHGKFSIGHIYKYKSDGNLTNMWMS